MSEQQKIGFWQKLWNEYNQLCKDMGVEQGGCRGCVPKIQFDEHGKRIETHLPTYSEHHGASSKTSEKGHE